MRQVVAPDGRRWRVGRRWTRRRVRWRRLRQGEEGTGPWWDGLDVLHLVDLAELHPALAVVALVAVALVLLGLGALVLVPLLLAIVDVVLLAVLLAVGGVARAVLGRPWEVEARTDGPPAESRSWRVRRWGGSGRAVDQVARGLEAGVADPSPDLAERSP